MSKQPEDPQHDPWDVPKELSDRERRHVDQVKQSLKELLLTEGNNYMNTDPIHHRRGGTRDIFGVGWGSGERYRIAKVDRLPEFVESPRSRSNLLDKSYGTFHELELVQGIYHQGITRLLDYFPPEVTDRFGISGAVLIEEGFPMSKSLEEQVTRLGTVEKREFFNIFRQVTKTIRDLNIGKGIAKPVSIFHRDLKPSNILVQSEEGALTNAKVTDLANACSTDSVQASFLPTAGGHLFADPLLMGPFIGEDSTYTEQSEIYSLAATMLFSIRGVPLFDFDPFKRRAIVWDTGETVLNKNGRIDKEKSGLATEKAVKSLPRRFRSLRPLLTKGLSLEKHLRYNSTDHFFNDFDPLAQIALSRGDFFGLGSYIGYLLLGSALALTPAIVLVGHLGEKVVEQEQTIQDKNTDLEYAAKARIILSHMNSTRRDRAISSDDDYIKAGSLEAYLDRFDDDRTAIAAFFSPSTVFAAIREADGKEDYKDIEQIIQEKDPKLYKKISEINPRFHGDATYAILKYQNAERERNAAYTTANKNWDQLQEDYKKMIELEKWRGKKLEQYEENKAYVFSPSAGELGSFKDALDDPEKEKLEHLNTLKEKFSIPYSHKPNQKLTDQRTSAYDQTNHSWKKLETDYQRLQDLETRFKDHWGSENVIFGDIRTQHQGDLFQQYNSEREELSGLRKKFKHRNKAQN